MKTLSLAMPRRRAFLTKLDIHGDTHPGLWERFNRMIDRLTPRQNERTNQKDAASGWGAASPGTLTQ
jgi:hypothetical protein